MGKGNCEDCDCEEGGGVMLICCVCICLVPLVVWLVVVAAEGPTQGSPYSTPSTTNGTANATNIGAWSDWSIAAKLTQGSQQPLVCDMFAISTKPYWMLLVVAFSESVYNYFFSTGGMGPLGAAWLAFKVVTTCAEIITLAVAVQGFTLPQGYHGEVTTWDRYELTMYLWAQSSVGTNLIGFLLYSLWGTFKEEKETLKLEEIGCLPKRGTDDGSVLGEESTMMLKVGITGVLYFVCLIPAAFTHIIPMFLLYLWVWPFLCIVGFVVVYAAFCVVCLPLSVTLCMNSCKENKESDKIIQAFVGILAPPFVFMVLVVLYQTTLSYGIQIYSRGISEHTYMQVVVDEWYSRSTSAYVECLDKGAAGTVLDTIRAVL